MDDVPLSTSAPRPLWAEALRLFLQDDIAGIGEIPETDDWLIGLVESAVNNIFCNAYGHEVVDDQCMRPSHRYCVYCGRRASVL